MSRIFWDTNLFIYLLEGHGSLGKRVVDLRRSMLSRGDQLLTSALTLGEVLVKPMEQGDHLLAGKYEQVDLFITNDARLHAKHIPGIQFIVPLEQAPL